MRAMGAVPPARLARLIALFHIVTRTVSQTETWMRYSIDAGVVLGSACHGCLVIMVKKIISRTVSNLPQNLHFVSRA